MRKSAKRPAPQKVVRKELLRQCGCGVGQGYYYARPLNRNDFVALLMPCSAAV
jgi:EAL domain-containing protein (putative c-di-GMP-specific phosphodiesterase class I)